MADLSLDDELLALAGGVESAEEGEASEKSESLSGGSRSPSRSRSLSRTPPPVSPLPRSLTPTSRRSRSDSRMAHGRSERRSTPDEEGELSDARSDAGSAAMDESDSEDESDSGARRPPPGETTFEREKRLAEEAEVAEERARTDKLKALIDERTQATKPAKRKAVDDEEDYGRRTSRQRTKKDDEDTATTRRRRLQRKYSDELEYLRDGYLEEDTAKVDEGKQPGTLAQYQRVRLGRSRFANVCFFNDFEDVFTGTFVRIHIDVDPTTLESMYRMCQIKGFTHGKPYVLQDDNGKKHAPDWYVLAEYGGKIKEYPLSHCSDGAFTDDEFNRRNQLIESEGLKQVTSKFLENKCAQISAFLEKKHTSAEIDAKLQRQYKHASILKTKIQATVGPETLRRDEALHRRNLDMARLNSEQAREALLAGRKGRATAVKKAAKKKRDIELGLIDEEGNEIDEDLGILPTALPRYEWMGAGKLARLRTDAEILGAMDFGIDPAVIKL